MTKSLLICAFAFILIPSLSSQDLSPNIRINQLGYPTGSAKYAYISDTSLLHPGGWKLYNSMNELVLEGISPDSYKYDEASDEYVYQIDFSELDSAGTYRMMVEGIGMARRIIISDHPYNDVWESIIKAFYYQRSGFELESEYAGKWARPAEYSEDAYIYLGYENGEVLAGEHVNTGGGWRDAGDPNKKVVPAAVAVSFIMDLAKYFNAETDSASWNIPKDPAFEMNDLQREIKFEIDWLLSMQREDGAVWHAVTQAGFYLQDMGHHDTKPRYLMPVSTTATADFAAACAKAYRVFKEVDTEYADSCLQSAVKAWDALRNDSIWTNPKIKGSKGQLQYPEEHGYSLDPPGIKHTANYTDQNDQDEKFWAAVELYISTNDLEYKSYIDDNQYSYFNYFSSWARVENIALLAYVMAFKDTDDPYAASLKNKVRTYANNYINTALNSGFQICMRPQDFYWGSNGHIGNFAYAFIMAYEVLGDQKYLNKAMDHVNYLLGANSMNQIFVSGPGANFVKNIFHLPSRFDGVEEVIPGFIAGGANKSISEWDKPHKELIETQNPPPAKCYVDSPYSFASNETAICHDGVWAFVLGYFFKQKSESKLDQEAPLADFPEDKVCDFFQDLNIDSLINATPPINIKDNTDPIISVSFEYESGQTNNASCSDVTFDISVIWNLKDGYGNNTSSPQLIRIRDHLAPEFIVPPDTSLEIGADIDPVFTGEPGGLFDNSEIKISISYSDSLIIETIQEMIIQRTWTCTDICGNDSSQHQIISILKTGIENKTIRGNLIRAVYPVPADHEICLETDELLLHEQFRILNTTGQIMYCGKLTSSETKIDIRGFPQGVYFLTIGETSRARVGQKIIITK